MKKAMLFPHLLAGPREFKTVPNQRCTMDTARVTRITSDLNVNIQLMHSSTGHWAADLRLRTIRGGVAWTLSVAILRDKGLTAGKVLRETKGRNRLG